MLGGQKQGYRFQAPNNTDTGIVITKQPCLLYVDDYSSPNKNYLYLVASSGVLLIGGSDTTGIGTIVKDGDNHIRITSTKTGFITVYYTC